MSTLDLQPLLSQIRAGDQDARDRLFEIVYEDLRLRARFELARGGRMSLNTTAVLHEAYLKIAGAERLEPEDQQHFMRIAARAMRNVIVDRARRRLSQKRGGGIEPVDLDSVDVAAEDTATSLVALDDALSRLEGEDERLAEVVHLRYFAGLPVADTAVLLGVSERTVKRDWRLARAILYAALAEDSEGEDQERS